jgi:hypothetical protein
MRARRLAAIALLPLAVFTGLACVGEPGRVFVDDSDAAGDAAVPPDGQYSGDSFVGGAETGGDDGGSLDSSGGDAGDSASREAGLEGGSDAGVEAGIDAEAGCGATNTIANCTACGLACDSMHSTPAACNGGTCSYSTCAPGWGDCVSAAPNTNGCETRLNSVTACTKCGSTCDTAHSTGPSCNGTSCMYAGCAAGYGDCILAAPDTDGCETPLNTTVNCTGCGVACDTMHSVGAACSGTGCTYSGCSSGWTTCNTTAPNAGGCACNTPAGCCNGTTATSAGPGATCQTTHINGFGMSFYDCAAPNTHTAAEALKACVAFTGNITKCSGGWTCAPPNDTMGPWVCNSSGSVAQCTDCWSYGGTDIGHVSDCSCPATDFGTWN